MEENKTEISPDIKLSELKAMISLLDDEDYEIVSNIENKLISLGTPIIPLLEKEWMEKSLMPDVRDKIEDIIHSLQYELLKEKLVHWAETGAEDLLEGMMLVANYQYPDLTIEYLRRKVEQLYYQAWPEFNEHMTDMEQVKTLNNVMYNKFKFRPNSKDFHAPSSSMINIVLESKKGNPLSLCVVYLLLAKRLKMPIYGVNLPNLFIVTYKTEHEQFYINVFNNGILFTKDDIDNYLEQLKLDQSDIFYQPCSHLDMVIRALRNLVGSFERLGEYKKSDDIKELIKALGVD